MMGIGRCVTSVRRTFLVGKYGYCLGSSTGTACFSGTLDGMFLILKVSIVEKIGEVISFDKRSNSESTRFHVLCY